METEDAGGAEAAEDPAVADVVEEPPLLRRAAVAAHGVGGVIVHLWDQSININRKES